jgi:hypothetical protein
MEDKYFVDKKGRAEEHIKGSIRKKDVHFPLCLAVKYGDSVPFECPDFLLSISKGKVFVETDSPLPEGSRVTLHFYIPPNAKLLAEFKGRVIRPPRNALKTNGSYIKIHDFFHAKLHALEQFLEEKRHLVDEEV